MALLSDQEQKEKDWIFSSQGRSLLVGCIGISRRRFWERGNSGCDLVQTYMRPIDAHISKPVDNKRNITRTNNGTSLLSISCTVSDNVELFEKLTRYLRENVRVTC